MTHYFAYEDDFGVHVLDVEDLWELAKGVPVTTMSIEQAVADVGDSYNYYDSSDWEKVLNSDTSYPVITFGPNDNAIMDGYHRIANLMMRGFKNVRIQALYSLPEPIAEFSSWEEYEASGLL